MPPLLLTPPPSLRDCASCSGLCGWEVCMCVCVCVCVCNGGSGEEWWRGKEVFCGPSNWSALALFSQTSVRVHTHTHTHAHSQSLSLFLVRERVECGLFQNTSGPASISWIRHANTFTHTHTRTHTHTHKPLMYSGQPLGKKVKLSCKNWQTGEKKQSRKPSYDRMREEKRRKGTKGGTGHSPGILTAFENNGQRDEREERGLSAEILWKST